MVLAESIREKKNQKNKTGLIWRTWIGVFEPVSQWRKKRKSVYWVPQKAFPIIILWNMSKSVAMSHDLFNQSFIIHFTKLNHCEEIRIQAQVTELSVTIQKMSLSIPFTLCHLLIEMNHSLPESKSWFYVLFVILAAWVWSYILETVVLSGTSLGIIAA